METQCVSNGITMNKTSALRIRLDPELHEQFLDICKAQDKAAAQVIREFMRDYVYKYKTSKQLDIFTNPQS